METKVINVGRDFSRYPAGRYLDDGPYSGEKFRDKFLLPAFSNSKNKVIVELDEARGYGSSFLEEAFGGVVRAGFSAEDVLSRLELKSQDNSLVEEIKSYILDEAKISRQH